jgi:hypothetical protein
MDVTGSRSLVANPVAIEEDAAGSNEVEDTAGTPQDRSPAGGQPAEDGVSILVPSGTDEQATDERRSPWNSYSSSSS